MRTRTSGSTALIRPQRRVALVLEVDQVDGALVGEQLEALVLRDHRPVLALAAADLGVGVDADDEDVALLLRAREVLDVPEVDQVERARRQHDAVSQTLEVGHGPRHLLQGGDEAVGEVDARAQDAAGHGHGGNDIDVGGGFVRAGSVVCASVRSGASPSPIPRMPNYLPLRPAPPVDPVPGPAAHDPRDGRAGRDQAGRGRAGRRRVRRCGSRWRTGAAVITERSIRGFVNKAIGELCAFINGARTLERARASSAATGGTRGRRRRRRRSRGLAAGRPRAGVLRARVPELHDGPGRPGRPGVRPARRT